jgi:two-component system, NtrC family, C4-dicarboxylate transport sensor histidine kinase DctB
MVNRISSNIQELDTINNSLEHTVEERTLSLVEANKELELYKNDLELKVKNAISEQEKTHILLAQQSKMASLGEMLASISHQWKQPLAIVSSINIKLQFKNSLGVLDSKLVNESTISIEKQLGFMTQTLNDFSHFFKPNKNSVEFSIKDSILKILNLFGKEYENKNIIISISENHPQTIKNFNSEFQQVVLNILNNARDVIVEKEIDNRAIDIHIEYLEDYVEIRLQDYAGGIDLGVISNIFKAYITTKSSEKGTGIGLFMSKRLVEESMGGKLSVENVNGGACFFN